MRVLRSVWPMVVLGVILALGVPIRPSPPAAPAGTAGALTAPARADRVSAQAPDTTTPLKKTVLLLFPYQFDLPISELAVQAIREEVGTADDLTLELYYEYLDLNRFSDSTYQQQLFDLLAAKYRNKPIDLVILASERMLDLWLEQRGKISPAAPVVFYDIVTERVAARQFPPDVTGVSAIVDHTQSVKWILRARPAVNEIVVVHGVGIADQDYMQPVDALIQAMGGQVRFTDLSDLPLTEIKRRVAALPRSSVVLYHLMFEDAAGVKYRPIDVLRELAAASAVPVISGYDQYIGAGTIGGYMYSIDQQARAAARIGLRILRGEAASAIPIAADQGDHFYFDHPALQRFGIPLSALPPNSIVKNRQYSAWDLYRSEVIMIVASFMILLLLVAFLISLTHRLATTRRALSHLNANLENQVQARTAALSQAKAVAEQASAELAVSEARFRSYFELPLIGIAITSPERGWLEVNAGLCAMLGYSAQELSGLTWDELTHPDDLAADVAQFNRVLAGEVDTYALEKRFMHKEGHAIWTNLSVGCVRNPDRTVKHIVALLQDISERKQAELALQESEAKYRFLAENIKDVIWTLDPETLRFLYVSPSVMRLRGYTPEEVMAEPMDAALTPEGARYIRNLSTQRTAAFAAGEEVTNSRFYTEEVEQPCKDGATVWTEVVTVYWRNAKTGRIEVHGVTRDISERKRVEAALQKSEALLRATGQIARVGGWELDVVTLAQAWTEEVYKIHEVGLDFEPTVSNGIDFYAPQARPIIARAVQRAIDDGEPFDLELPFITAKGNRLWIHAIGHAQRRDGRTTKVLGIFQDITERKQAEARVFELALERERVGILTRFIQDASHEFRTPLSIMQTNVYLLERLEDGPKRQRKLAQIGDQVTGLTRLVDLLAEMARLDSTVSFTTQPTDLNQLIGAEAGKLQTHVTAKGLTLQLALAPDLPLVAADGHRLGRALHELLDNAVRFTPVGGNITVRSAADAVGMTVEVQDSGPGIPPDVLPHIFERFYRQDVAHTTPGFGLGLPIARAIVERHGGRLEVESQLGAGSVFRIVLQT